MKRLTIALLGVFAAALLTGGAGCDGGESTSAQSGTAGAVAGTSGTAGNTGGSAGSAGDIGGTAGSAGDIGGTAGTAGNAGTSGSAGSGGTAGTSGTAGSSGSAGSGGAMPCMAPADCGEPPNECTDNTCDNNVCGTVAKAAGTPTASQMLGDCKVSQCDGTGNVISADDNADLPDDNNLCTVDACSMGTATFTPKPVGTKCGVDLMCNAAGQCVGCSVAADCPGADEECKVRTCENNICGTALTPSGTLAGAQTDKDCKKNVCDGAGNLVSQNDNADLPADDGNQCTGETCVAGVPAHTLKPENASCNQNGGAVCSAGGACVQCNIASQCPGMDTECKSRTCNGNACGVNNVAAGTPTSTQVTGDCTVDQCNGSGFVVTVEDNADLPLDDGNQCTAEVCMAGAPAHPALPADTACNQNGGVLCSAAGLCVQCNTAGQCPGMDTECVARGCSAGGACFPNFAAAGTPVSMQTAGDCKENQCDGLGNVVVANKDVDLPVDSNQCTDDVCASGAPANPFSPAGATCNQGGLVCDGAGVCQPPPQVASTAATDGATGVATQSTIVVTFTVPMSPASLTAQVFPGACSGSIQVSSNDFSSCIGFTSPLAIMGGGNTIATLIPLGRLFAATTYRIRVTTAAQSALGLSLAATFTQPNGFITVGGTSACDGNLVISQVYGGGNNGGAPYQNDFVELHNIGTTPVSVNGLSLQYASDNGTAWGGNLALSSMNPVAPGGFFLVQLAGGMVNGAPLPTPDQIGAISMAATAGKVALVRGTPQLASGACPDVTRVLDFVGYGGTSTCFEGTGKAPAPSNTNAILRGELGCADTNANNSNFTTGAPTPRNSASPVSACTCNAVANEVGTAAEVDYCALQFPASFSVQAGQPTGNIYGRVYELGTTPTSPGPALNVVAQLGYGPNGSNPATSNAWLWYSATFNAGFMDASNDEHQQQLTAPAAGSYAYAYRFSFDGLQWTYCDSDGAGSNPGLDFSPAAIGAMTVTP